VDTILTKPRVLCAKFRACFIIPLHVSEWRVDLIKGHGSLRICHGGRGIGQQGSRDLESMEQIRLPGYETVRSLSPRIADRRPIISRELVGNQGRPI
jgi:hypothetical protein